MDDDDIYTREAFATVRRALADHALAAAWIFRMRAGGGSTGNTAGGRWGGELWSDAGLRFGQVGTPMFVVPTLPDMPKWADHPKTSHDFGFISAVVHKSSLPVIWRPEVISIIRPSDA